MLTVTKRRNGDVSILDLSGTITLGESTGILRNTVKDLIANGDRKILLNLGEVTFIDSAGLGELISSYVTMSNLGGQMKIAQIQNRIRDLLQITKVCTIFEVYESEHLAVLSME